MIAAVKGEVMVRRHDHVVVDAAGVGYRLTVSAETLKSVPATGRDAFLHAELISVAGRYRVSENIPVTLKGVPVQIFLEQEILRIEKL